MKEETNDNVNGSGNESLEDKIGLVNDNFDEAVKYGKKSIGNSVEDSLPDYDISVLAHNGNSFGITHRTHNDYARDKNDFMLLLTAYDIKYWMKIPPIPDNEY